MKIGRERLEDELSNGMFAQNYAEAPLRRVGIESDCGPNGHVEWKRRKHEHPLLRVWHKRSPKKESRQVLGDEATRLRNADGYAL